ncbi:HAD family hydrolase [Lentilactobacillus senioris]|uniref:HAD family hydrolase n=1 Tax=Lentilactobacillus senioris TaxID=931534 RepID=UPI0022832360|nr:HAD family hydrolase [Lentilactobacillus senioris]MCY9807123.1 HAD family hydrolase [Lentilactobacillus senioris]
MQNFIFDIDGTLIDTEKMYIKPLYDVLVKRGYDITYDQAAATFGITAIDALKRLNVTDQDAVMTEWNQLIPNYAKYLKVYAGIPESLAELKQTKKLAIATSKVRSEFERDFTPIGINHYFNEVVTSDEVATGKPAPDMILKGMEKLNGTPETTVYVGDTVYDMQAAHSANVAFALAGWRTPADENFQKADYVLNQPNDLLKL